MTSNNFYPTRDIGGYQLQNEIRGLSEGSGQRYLLGGNVAASYGPQKFNPQDFGPQNNSGFEPNYFNELSTIRENNRTTAQNNLDAYGNSLNTGLDTYASGAGSLIDNQAAGLARYNSDYLSKTDASIAADEANRRRLRAQFGIASRLGVQSAINDGTRSSKAMFAQRGGGGGSYSDRLAIGIRQKANADSALQLSQLDRTDALAVQDARNRRDALAFDTGRSDLTNIYGDRSRLNTDIYGRRTANLGSIYGEQSRINTNDANAYRTDIGATRLIAPTRGSLLPQALQQPTYITLPRNRLRRF